MSLALFRQLNTLFPLTLALSPGERERVSAGRNWPPGSEHSPARSTVLPLLEGEGWGEGEHCGQLPGYGVVDRSGAFAVAGDEAVEIRSPKSEVRRRTEVRSPKQSKVGYRFGRFGIVLGVFLCLMASGVRADNTLTDAERSSGWLLLFDGKTLDGWMTSESKPSKRSVEDGCINPHRCGHYMMVHTQQWSNFELSLDFKISPGCNSGIFVRTPSLTPLPGKDVGYNGLEVQIIDSTNADYYDTGAIYDLSKPTRNAMKPAGQWNHAEVTCNGSVIDVVINGEKVNHIYLDQFSEPRKRPDGTSHKFEFAYKNHPRKGYIGLQDHGSDCWFKNIKLRPLK
jgi:hypothetical protein